MNFLSIMGAFAAAAAVLVWASTAGVIGPDVVGGLAILFVVAGIIYPFYTARQAKKNDQEKDSADKK